MKSRLPRSCGVLAIVMLALFAASCAHAGNANRLRLALGRTASIGPTDQTVTLRGTDLEPIPLTAAVAPCTATELINVSFTGSVIPVVWNFPTMAASTTYSFYKNELVANQGLTLAQTTALSDGTNAGQMTVSCSGGTYVTQFDVASPEIIAWNYGAKTLLRYAGYPTSFLSGGATDWTTADPNWEVWNNHLMIKCISTGGVCTAQGGTTYSTGSVAPAIAVASRTGADVPVVITSASLGATKTITMHWVPQQWDMAPTPSWLTNGTANSQLCISLITGHNYGDTYVAEAAYGAPLQYPAFTGGNCISGSGLQATVRSGGPSAPTLPYDAGWVTAKPRIPFGAAISAMIIDARGLNKTTNPHENTALRFSQFDCALLAGNCFTVTDLGASSPHNVGLTQWDHNKFSGFVQGTPTDGSWNLYLTDNYIDGFAHGNGLVQFYSWDCKIDGNKSNGAVADALDFTCPNSTPGSHFASISWNFITNKQGDISGGHSDFSQLFGTPAWLQNLTGDVDEPDEIGNIFVRGAGHIIDCHDIYTNGVVGSYDITATTCKPPATVNPNNHEGFVQSQIGNTEISDGQIAFRADIPGFGQQYATTKILGMIGVGTFGNGLATRVSGDGTFMRRSTLTSPWYVTHSIAPSNAAPSVSINGASSLLTLEDNAVTAITASASFSFAPVGTGFVDNGHTNKTSLLSTDFACVTSTGCPTYDTIQHVLDNLALVSSPGKGAINNGVNHRLRTYTAGLMDPPTFTAAPRCTTSPTVQLVGGVLSVTNTPAFSGSPSSFEVVWEMYKPGAAVQFINRTPGAGPTYNYTTVAGDSTYTAYFIMAGVNAGGKGSCVAVGIAVP